MFEDAKNKIAQLKNLLSGLERIDEKTSREILNTIVDVLNELVNYMEEVESLPVELRFISCPSCSELIEVDEDKLEDRNCLSLRCEKCGEMVLITKEN